MLIGLDKFVDFTISLAAPALASFRESLGLEPDVAGNYLYRAWGAASRKAMRQMLATRDVITVWEESTAVFRG